VQGFQFLARDVLQLECNRGNDLVRAIEWPGVEPAGRDLNDFETLGEIDLRAAPGGREQAGDDEQQARRAAARMRVF
jgi:hypothetical protein